MAEMMAPPIPVVPPPYWTEERERIQTEAREFAMNEVLPLANELDKQKAEIPRWFLDRIGEKRYFGITIPTEYGGLGLGTFEYCMITEELARAWMSVASIIVRAQGGGTQHVADPERRRRLLEMSARGQWIGAAALSEPGAGSDLANVQTRAVRDGDELVITGQKRWTGNAKAADFITLLCRTDDPRPGEPRSRGLWTTVRPPLRDRLPSRLGARPQRVGAATRPPSAPSASGTARSRRSRGRGGGGPGRRRGGWPAGRPGPRSPGRPRRPGRPGGWPGPGPPSR